MVYNERYWKLNLRFYIYYPNFLLLSRLFFGIHAMKTFMIKPKISCILFKLFTTKLTLVVNLVMRYLITKILSDYELIRYIVSFFFFIWNMMRKDINSWNLCIYTLCLYMFIQYIVKESIYTQIMLNHVYLHILIM